MPTDFYIGQDDRLPTLHTVFSDADGPMDLTGATITMHGRKAGADTLITGPATPDPDQTTNRGHVDYLWEANDTTLSGRWWIQWVGVVDGKQFTVPNRGADEVWINPFYAGEIN